MEAIAGDGKARGGAQPGIERQLAVGAGRADGVIVNIGVAASTGVVVAVSRAAIAPATAVCRCGRAASLICWIVVAVTGVVARA